MSTQQLDRIQHVSAVPGRNCEILLADMVNPFGDAMKKLSSQDRNLAASKFNSIHMYKPHVYSSFFQELLFAFHNIFTNLVESSLMDSDDITERYNAALKLSRAYRAEMANYSQRIHSALLRHQQYEDAQFTEESFIALLQRVNRTSEDVIEEEMREFESTQSLWYLFEIMHFDPASNVTSQLRDWLQRTVEEPAYVSEFFEALDPNTMEFSLPYGREVNSAVYWAALEQLVITGRVALAVRMLHANELLDAKHPGLRDTLIELLLQCPSFDHAPDVDSLRHALQVSLPDADQDLEDRFTQWRARVLSTVTNVEQAKGGQSRVTLAALPFGTLFRILQGDTRTLSTVCTDWKHLMVGTLLFRKPWANKADVAWLVDEAIASVPTTPTPYDDAVRTLLAQPAGPALRILDKLLGATWVSAHLTDLYSRLHAISIPLAAVALAESPDVGADEAASTAALTCPTVDYAAVEGELPVGVRKWLSDPSSPQDLRELTLIHHARALASQGLWSLAVTYYSACTHTWLPQLEQLLCSVPPTDANVEELLSICAKLKLSHAHTRICSVMCARSLSAGRSAHAVHWALRGGDNARANAIADVLLTLAYADDVTARTRARAEVALLSKLLSTVVVDADGMGTEITFALCPHNVATTTPATVAVLFHLHDAWTLTDALAASHAPAAIDAATQTLSASTSAVLVAQSQRLTSQTQMTLSQTQAASAAVAAAHALYCAMRVASLRVARVLAIALAALGAVADRAGVSVCICGEEAVLLALQCLEQSAALSGYSTVPPPQCVREVLLGSDADMGDDAGHAFVSADGTAVMLPLGANASDTIIDGVVSENDASVALSQDCEATARQQLNAMLILSMQEIE